jgi:hypothetical protein
MGRDDATGAAAPSTASRPVAAAASSLPNPPSSPSSSSSSNSSRMAAIMDVARALVKAYDEHGTVNILRLRQQAASRHGLAHTPKLLEVLAALPESRRDALLPYLRAKPIRSASGIAVVAVMCKPHRCPHVATTGAVCVYCPGGPDSDFEYSTQAYTGYEPTSMRAIRARYHPHLQTRSRVEQLRGLGHATDKVEFIIMGGTFLSMDPCASWAEGVGVGGGGVKPRGGGARPRTPGRRLHACAGSSTYLSPSPLFPLPPQPTATGSWPPSTTPCPATHQPLSQRRSSTARPLAPSASPSPSRRGRTTACR